MRQDAEAKAKREELRGEEEVAATLPVASPTPEHKSASSIFGGLSGLSLVQLFSYNFYSGIKQYFIMQ